MAAYKPDRFARCASVAAIAVSAASAYFTWARSPFFDAPPVHMAYWQVESNTLTEDKLPQSAELRVVVANNSDRPAKNVLVVVTPLSPTAAIACSVNYEVLDGPKGSRLVTLERIPPKSIAEVHVSEDVKAYPERFSWMGGAKFRYCAKVEDVQTEFGPVRCDYPKCKDNTQRLPGDDGQSYL
jgi:hypothetical protein